jgi:hypothetical protein
MLKSVGALMTKEDALKWTAAINESKERLQYFEELCNAVAKEKMLAYNGFINAGFTNEQALYLCK